MRPFGWIALTALFFLMSCGENSAPGQTQPVSDSMTVGVVTAPPISSIDATTLQPKGNAIDLIERIAERGQIKVDFVPTDWANMSAALSSGRVRVVVGPIFQTEARAKEFIFTLPIWSYAIVAVKKAGDDRVQSRQDLIDKPLRVAVAKGGFSAEFASRIMKNAEITYLPPDQPDGSMLEILAGRADVAIVARATATRFIRTHPELALVADGKPISMQLAGFMLRRDDSFAQEFLNVALRNLAVSGEMAILSKPYVDDDAFYAMPLVQQYDVGERIQ